MWLNLDASWSRGTGETSTHFVPGGSSSGDTTLTQFPQLDTKLAVKHNLTNRLGYAFRYWFESWKEQNFASDFNQPYMGDPGNDPSMDKAIPHRQLHARLHLLGSCAASTPGPSSCRTPAYSPNQGWDPFATWMRLD
jgi:hypothetical protein